MTSPGSLRAQSLINRWWGDDFYIEDQGGTTVVCLVDRAAARTIYVHLATWTGDTLKEWDNAVPVPGLVSMLGL